MPTPFFLILAAVAAAGVLAALGWLAAAGFRNGDLPGDALVSAVPGAPAVLIRNPSDAPVIAGLAVRPALLPGWPGAPHEVSVPRRTARARFGPQRYECFVVPAGGAVSCAVPSLPGRAPGRAGRPRRVVLTVLAGQQGGRLRVHRLRPGAAGFPAEGKVTIMVA